MAIQNNYKTTLEYLFSQLPMYHRVGAAAFKKDLTNTLALCEHLDNPQHKFPSIHIAGTNGKGSVSHLIAAVLQSAGLKTGLYISPHYKDFRERIKINGKYIPRKNVVNFVANHKETLERIQPSFFEMTVGMAFDYFAAEKVDIAVIEVGLGGRFDSTNVINPLLSVITNISFDHVAMLGDTLPQIAIEKAGIIKPNIPVVIGELHPETLPVFNKKANECNVPIVLAPSLINLNYHGDQDWQKSNFEVKSPFNFKEIIVDTAGPYQQKNVATALAALSVLKEIGAFKQLKNLEEAHILQGFANLRSLTRFIGRWQIIGNAPTILCDSAHNEAGITTAFEEITKKNYSKIHIVTGFVNDKDIDKVLTIFPKNAQYYFAKANIPRGLDANILKEKAEQLGLKGKSYTSVKNALKSARKHANPEELIVVIGSIFVVAEVI
jgi:dihydrofolate synthase / folylpolyglutamate synthase